MTLIDFNKKELHDIYSALQYTRLETGFENESEEELYNRLTKLMDKVAKLRQVCDCQEKQSVLYHNEHFCFSQIDLQHPSNSSQV